LLISPDTYAAEVSGQFLDAYDIVRKHIGSAHVKMSRLYNPTRRDFTYQSGDYVWLRQRPKLGKKKKLSPQYAGPYVIIKKLSDLVYKITDAARKEKKRKIVNINRLKPYLSREEINPSDDVNDSAPDPQEPVADDDTVDESAPDIEEEENTDDVPSPVPVPATSDLPTFPTRSARSSRRLANADAQSKDLFNTLADLRDIFEATPSYSLVALKAQLTSLLTTGSLLVRSTRLHTRFAKEIKDLNARADALFFLHRLTEDFNNEFKFDLDKQH
jgi:hypothetical protein